MSCGIADPNKFPLDGEFVMEVLCLEQHIKNFGIKYNCIILLLMMVLILIFQILTNTFLKGTSPNYDQSSKSYTWAGRDVPGTPEAEEFNHSLVTPAITPTISLSSYSTQVSYQITTTGH